MWLTAAIGAVTGIVKGVKAIVGSVKKAKPVVKVSSAAVGGALVARSLSASSVGTLAAPGGIGGLPALAMGQTQAIQQAGAGGLPVPFWKGPGGKLQMPWNDPRIPEYLKQFALDDAYLRVYYRAPRGYVIVRDASGRPFAVNKMIARQFGLWRSPAKPPISATEWKHYKSNQRIEKKLRKIAGPALRKTKRTVAASTKKGR